MLRSSWHNEVVSASSFDLYAKNSGKDLCKSSVKANASSSSSASSSSLSFPSFSLKSRKLMLRRASSQSLLFLNGPRNMSCLIQLPQNISIEMSSPGSNRRSGESAAKPGLRKKRLPMPLNFLAFICAIQAAICLITVSFSAQLIQPQASASTVPGIWSINIRSNPNSLSESEHIAITRGTGIEVSRLSHSSVAASLSIFR